MIPNEYRLAVTTVPELGEQLCVFRPDGTILLAMCEQSPYHNSTVAALVAELNRLYNREPGV